MGEACSTHGERSNVYKVLVGKAEAKRSLGNPRHRWEDNTKMDLTEIGWDRMGWIDLAQDRGHWWALVNTVMNLCFPKMYSTPWC
jgi:hypothetical protein